MNSKSASSIRGKLRQQYIDNWLAGNEDPDVEVIPTRVEGKYIVKHRTQVQSDPVEVQPSQDTPKVEDNNPVQKQPPKVEDSKDTSYAAAMLPGPAMLQEEEDEDDIQSSLCSGLGLVLQQLQRMAQFQEQAQVKEEQRAQKKEEKKKLKAMVQAQLSKHYAPSYPQQVPEQPPAHTGIRTRRRLNLLDRDYRR